MVTVPWTRNERGALAGLKTTSYAENVVALARAQEQGAAEALFANTVGTALRGHRHQRLRRPRRRAAHPAARLRLPRGHHPRAGRWSGRGRRETDLPLDVLDRADEVFLTSTTRDVQAVHRVDGRELPGAPGPVTAKAMRIFDERRRGATRIRGPWTP